MESALFFIYTKNFLLVSNKKQYAHHSSQPHSWHSQTIRHPHTNNDARLTPGIVYNNISFTD